jgi:molybdopterin-guanine dinucleotide biosynthesis protein A
VTTAKPLPELIGLVLAGGQSQRMRRDKGTLEYFGLPQAEHCYRLLTPHCARVFVSASPSQLGTDPYAKLPLIADAGNVRGPAAGLLAAWSSFPDAALLTLAVDLPLVDAVLLEQLVAGRNPEKAATAWTHPDGILEPVCAIWEPALHPGLAKAASDRSPSLRRLLQAADVERLEPRDPNQIVSVNTEAGYRAVVDSLHAGDRA